MAQFDPFFDLDVTAPKSTRKGLIYTVGPWWELVKDYWDILRPMRFCVLVWIAVTILIVLIPQSQDALLALLEDALTGPGMVNLSVFAFFALIWAVETFYWGRFVSRLPARERRPIFYKPPRLSAELIEKRNAQIPRVLGTLVLISVLVALGRAGWPNIGREAIVIVMMIVLGSLYWGFVLSRRRIVNALNRRHLAAAPVDPKFKRGVDEIRVDGRVKRWALGLAIATFAAFVASGFVALPAFSALAIASVWLAFLLWAAGRIDGVPAMTLRFNIAVFGVLFLASIDSGIPIIGWSSRLPSAPIIMSVAAAWVFIGTFFVAVPGELLRLPIATLVVLFAVVSSVIGCSDNHRVALLKPAPGAQVAGTPLSQAFDQWWKDKPKSAEPTPLVLVATAGGASRAAYWTTEVLARIEQDHPGFHKYVFAISSVSGGSLGAVVYRTMLNDVIADDGKTPGDKCAGKATRTSIVRCGLDAINHDFLGPTFLTGLYPDLTQRYLPGTILPDRGRALEHSWEEGWRAAMPKSTTGLDKPFHSIWGATSWLPALIINGTSEKTGRRIITSNLLIEDDRFTDALDFFTKVIPGSDVAISTAAHNSARFPYIDAAGTLMNGNRIADRIVDGGYFENFGAGSIYDLRRALDRIKGDRKIKFFVIQITSDPELESAQADRDISWQTHNSPFSLNVASDATAPPAALFNTGGALGYRAMKILKDDVGDSAFAEFRLTNSDVTLSWVLSKKAVGLLDKEWAANRPSYDKLKTFMSWN